MSRHDLGKKATTCPECDGVLTVEFNEDYFWCPYCSIKVLKEPKPDSCCECPHAIEGPMAIDEDGFSLGYHEAECGLGECKRKVV